MREWKEIKLGDICAFQEGYVNPSQNFPEYFDGNIKWLRATDLNNGYVYNTTRTLTQKGFESAGKSALLFKPNTIGISKSGTIGRLGILKDYMCGNRAVINIAPSSEVDTKFIYYTLLSMQSNFEHLAVGSVQKNLYVPILADISIKLPPLAEQQRIASILSSLDDKIELNNTINKNLEEQAQTLFKNWFIDFEPFGGEMPKDWKVGKLSDIVNVKYGKDHKKLGDGIIPVYGSGGIMRYADQFLYDKESVLIPRKGTLNNIFYISEPFWSVDTMFYTEMLIPNAAKFVYFFMKEKDLQSLNAGSAVPSMTTEILNALPVVIPPAEQLQKYDRIVSSMFKKIDENLKEIANLTNLRNSLLQKLIHNN